MLTTYSAFTYGHTVTDDNKFINFNEGSGELSAEIEIGSYTLQAYVDAVANALNTTGTQEYTVTVDRSNRFLTIDAMSNFDLLVSSGAQAGSDAYSLMGFTGSDRTGSNSYTGNTQSGSYFEPQLYLQQYVDFEDNLKTTNANVNQSASGVVEVVSYGVVKYMECNISHQTDIVQGKGSVLKTDQNGVENLRLFMTYCISKAPIEFIPDLETPNAYTDCLLESTRESRQGVDFKLKEMYAKFSAFYFETGTLVFRELI